MSYEQKILVALGDIRSICFQCKKCEAKISVSPDFGPTAPARCFQCQAEWIKAAPAEPSLGQLMPDPESDLIKLAKGVAGLRKADASNAYGFRVLFEFDVPQH